MDEQENLIVKQEEISKQCISTPTKVILLVMLYGSAAQVSVTAEPQYIYAYLKYVNNHSDKNIIQDVSKDKVCAGNSSSVSEEKIQGLGSDWVWYITLAQIGLAVPILIFGGQLPGKIGRKPIFLWNTSLTFISFALKTIVVYRNMSLIYYVIASCILGISGSFYTFHMYMYFVKIR